MEKTKVPYHDNSMYIDDDEFDDDFDSSPETKNTNFQINKDDDSATVQMKNKLNYKTDTSDYNSFQFELISPEEANAQSSKLFEHNEPNASKEYADPVIAQAVYQIENKLGRKINYDEFDKLCKTYAAELTNRDAEYRGNGEEPNPIDYKMYYDTLIQNKKVKPAYEIRMTKYEDSLVTEIDQLMLQHQEFDSRDIHVERGAPINMHHKGKVFIRDEANNQEIKIDNKRDVDLLRMKYRQDWIEKKYKKDIDSEINGNHSNDGFE